MDIEQLQSRVSRVKKKRRAVLVNLQDWIRRSNRRQRNDQSVARPVRAASGEGDNRQIPHLFPWWLLVQARVPSPPLLPPQTVLEPFYSLLGVLVFSCSGDIYAEHFRRESLLPFQFLLQKDHTDSTGLGYLFFVIFTLMSRKLITVLD